MKPLQSTRVQMKDGTVLNVWQSPRRAAQTSCVLIHGFADGAFVWTGVVQSLAETCHLVVVDLRGHGESMWSANGDYQVRTHVADICEVTRALSLQQIVFVGHSLGGQIAIHMAATHADVVRGMIIVDFGPDLNTTAKEQARDNLRNSLRVYGSIEEYRSWLLDTRPLLTPDIAKWLAEGAMRRCPGGFELKLDPVLAELDLDDPGESDVLWHTLANITCPVLVMRGAGSALFPRDAAERMRRTLPNGKLQVVHGAGHAIMVDNPTAFVANVLPFLRGRAQLGARDPLVETLR